MRHNVLLFVAICILFVLNCASTSPITSRVLNAAVAQNINDVSNRQMPDSGKDYPDTSSPPDSPSPGATQPPKKSTPPPTNKGSPTNSGSASPTGNGNGNGNGGGNGGSKPPSQSPSQKPSQSPSQQPTQDQTQTPTYSPTQAPTQGPTETPTKEPTQKPGGPSPSESPSAGGTGTGGDSSGSNSQTGSDPSNNAANSSGDSSGAGGLSTPAIVGIAVGSGIAALAAVALIIFAVRKRAVSRSNSYFQFPDADETPPLPETRPSASLDGPPAATYAAQGGSGRQASAHSNGGGTPPEPPSVIDGTHDAHGAPVPPVVPLHSGASNEDVAGTELGQRPETNPLAGPPSTYEAARPSAPSASQFSRRDSVASSASSDTIVAPEFGTVPSAGNLPPYWQNSDSAP